MLRIIKMKLEPSSDWNQNTEIQETNTKEMI